MAANSESFIDMAFPVKGIDLSKGFSLQVPGTTPVGANVRAFDSSAMRARGGSRPGLDKYIATQPNGTNVIQELNSVVGVGFTAPGLVTADLAFVQKSVGSVSVSTLALASTFSVAVTTGHGIVVLVTSVNRLPSSITDSQSNTYTMAASGSDGTRFTSIWYNRSVTGGGSFSVTAHFAALTGCSCSAVELAGLATAPLDQTNSHTGSGTPATPGSVTLSSAPEIVFICLQTASAVSVSAPSGYTDIFGPSASLLGNTAYQVFSSETTTNPAWTISGGAWAACIATFRGSFTTVQTSQSSRIVTLVSVVRGNVFVAPAGGSTWTPAINNTGLTLATTGVVRSASLNQKLYFADGAHWLYYQPSDNTVRQLVASAGSLPGSNISDFPRLICNWRGRLVVAGLRLDPHNFFMSRIDDPTDWDYFPGEVSSDQPVSGNSAPEGLVGDVITAIIPYSDDELVVGCDSSIWIFKGDLMAGGGIMRVSNQIGMAWGNPWTTGPDGTLYFFSNKTGIYSMVLGQAPVRISQTFEQLISDLDTGANIIRMSWDDLWQGLHVFITPASAASATTHFFWESRTGAWWSDTFGNEDHNPLCCCTFDGNLTSDRRALIGSWDGYVRCMTPESSDDDGTAILSSVVIGPLLTRDLDTILLKDLQAILGEDSGEIDYAVYVGTTAEKALSSTPIATGTWQAGRNLLTPTRWSAHAIYVKLSSTNKWAMETIRARTSKQGKAPRRGY